MRTPNREPQEYSSRNVIGIYLPGSVYPIIFLQYSWGSLFGVPIKIHLGLGLCMPWELLAIISVAEYANLNPCRLS